MKAGSSLRTVTLMRFVTATAVLLLFCFTFSVAEGCLYTVRDVGFVDIGTPPYRLYFYTNKDTPESEISTFRQISYAALMDTNVRASVIHVDAVNADSAPENEQAAMPSLKQL